jgi:hypothetical protein
LGGVSIQSRIFTDAELKAIERRKNGDRKDRTGIFYGRVKPKIKEILSMDFKELEKLILSSRK